MTNDEFEQHWEPARDALSGAEKGNGRIKDSVRLANLFDLPYPSEGYYSKLVLTEQMKRVLRTIRQPHAETLMRMYEAQKRV